MGGKSFRTYCMFASLVSFYLYLANFERNLDIKIKAFTTFFKNRFPFRETHIHQKEEELFKAMLLYLS